MILKISFLTMFLCFTTALQGQSFPVLKFQKFFDNFGDDHPSRLLKSEDGNLILGGHTVIQDSMGTSCGDIWIIKIDTLGTLLWERELILEGCEELRDLVETDDGGILFVGVTTSLIPYPEKGDKQFWANVLVGKIDSLGRVEWLQSYGGSNLDQAFRIVKGPYHDFLIAGFTHSNNGDILENKGLSDLWSLKIDNQGRIKDSRTVGGKGNDWGMCVSTCQNGDFLISGYTDSPDMSDRSMSPHGNGLLVRFSAVGQVRWIKTYPCPSGGYFTKVEELPNERILLSGQCRSVDQEQRFWWLLTSPEGLVIHEKLIDGPQPGRVTSAISCEGGFVLAGYSDGSKQTSRYDKGGEDFWLVKLSEEGKVQWRSTYGGPGDERCVDVIAYRPGQYYALGQKRNQFTRPDAQDLDFWLLKVEERPSDSIEAGIWIRKEENKVFHNTPIRFSSKYRYGDRFLWDFGDGTTSTEAHPLKRYDIPGLYDVSLTIFVNDYGKQTVTLPQPLEVW